MKHFRTGFGYDSHRLEEGKDFWLGGIKIPHYKGATGHSDADALIHAICDALLGAAALGDIGKHFPDTSDEYKTIDSKILLDKTMLLIRDDGYEVSNIDSTIVLQKPKIADLIPAMQNELAQVMQLESNQISIKATTNEGMGFEGEEKGLTAYAVALIYKKHEL